MKKENVLQLGWNWLENFLFLASKKPNPQGNADSQTTQCTVHVSRDSWRWGGGGGGELAMGGTSQGFSDSSHSSQVGVLTRDSRARAKKPRPEMGYFYGKLSLEVTY